MSVQMTTKPPTTRILSGNPLKVEAELNALDDEYVVIETNFAVVKDELTLTLILIHQSELRKMRLANLAVPWRRQ
jgi:hypothetical protein